MKTVLFLAMSLVFAGVLSPCVAEDTGTAWDEPLANANLSGLYVRSIEGVLHQQPDQIDVGIAALIVSEAWSDMVSGRRYQQQLDDMAREIRSRLKTKEPSPAAISVINNYLFDELKFGTIDKADDPYDLFLHSVMDRRRGYCLSLSILYLAIGERLGLPLYGVVVPGHFFVRYDDGKVRFNIETTSGGSNPPDSFYIEKFNIPKNENSNYMNNLNKLQTLGCFFNNLANAYKDVGNVDQAMAGLQCAIYINPTISESRINLGNIYLQKGRVDEAINEYQAAIKINSNDSRVHHNLGNAYQERKRFDDAAAEYIRSIQLDPNFVDAYRNLAIAYRNMNRFSDAEATLIQATAIAPQNAFVYLDLADVYSQSDNCDEAIARYQQALGIKPDLAEAYLGLGICYNKLEQADKEIGAYVKALSINPNMYAALVNLGNAYFAKEKYDVAIEQYNKAVRISPNDAQMHYRIGVAYTNKGDFRQALKAQTKAIEIDPQMAEAHYAAAYDYYMLANYDSALEHIKTAEQLGATIDPNFLKAIENKN
jgi:tetratricopeptide (TPR) repeat protein